MLIAQPQLDNKVTSSRYSHALNSGQHMANVIYVGDMSEGVRSSANDKKKLAQYFLNRHLGHMKDFFHLLGSTNWTSPTLESFCTRIVDS